MRFYATVAAAALMASMATAAGVAEAGDHHCFDKGALGFSDCGHGEREGPYFLVKGGIVGADDTEFNFNAATPIDNEYDLGWAVSGGVGYEFVEVEPGVDLRAELELGYQLAEIDQHVIGGAGIAGSFGETGVFFGFANLYADIELVEQIELVLGGGLGFGDVDFDGHGIPGLVALGDDDVVFGYHLDAGLSYDISPDVALEATYRYSSFLDAELTSNGGFSNEVDVDSHQGLIGLRFKM